MNMTPPPNPPDVSNPKKGLHPMAYVGIGCGGLLLIGTVAGGILISKLVNKTSEFIQDPTMALAALVVQSSPDLELVQSDSDSGILQVKVESTGETITIDRAQIESGKFSYTKVNADGTEEITNIDFSGAENGEISITDGEGDSIFQSGEQTPDSIPDWVPAYPGATNVNGTFKATINGTESGSFSLKTTDSPSEVLNTYKPLLEDIGFTVTTQGVTKNGKREQSILTGKDTAASQTINLIIIPTNEGSSIQATYSTQP